VLKALYGPMRYFFTATYAFLFSTYTLGVELNGTWKEDLSKTIEWNSTHRINEEGYLKKLKAVIGHFYISYSNGEMCNYTEPFIVSYKGKSTDVGPIFLKGNYQVIANNKFGYVVKSEIDGHQNIDMLIFENDKSMYAASLTTEDYGQPGLRTYFKKVKLPTEMEKCSE